MKTFALLAATLWSVSMQSPALAASCNAPCLRVQLDRYLSALLEHDPSSLPVAAGVRYTENGRTIKLGEGLWKTASSISSYAHYFSDPVSQQALFLGIVNEGDAPAIVALRLGVESGEIAEVEHIVARKGSHALFAPETLTQPDKLLTMPIAESARVSRAQMIAVADSYFEGIEQHSSSTIVAADNCQRIENGVQTTNRPGRGSRNCQESADLLTYIKSVDNRRFPIIDVERGVVIATVTFDIPGDASSANDAAIAPNAQVAAKLRQPRTLLMSEWFKIERGVITHIEAVMHNLPRGATTGWEDRR